MIALALAIAACTPGQLHVSHGQSEGATGHVIVPIVFTNESATSCTLFGYPGVSSVSSEHGKQVGKAAARTPSARHTITLKAHGGKANALVLETNPDFVDGCHKVTAQGFRIYPPGQKQSFYVHLKHSLCTGTADQVRPVAAGSGS